MASTITSPPPTRRALGALDVNTPTSRASLSGPFAKTTSPSKSSKMGEVSSSASDKIIYYQKNSQQTGLGSQKRSAPVSEENTGDHKRRRSETMDIDKERTSAETQGRSSLHQSRVHVDVDSEALEIQSDSGRQRVYAGGREPGSSPGSSNVSFQVDLNESQDTINTTMTEPDEAPLPAPAMTSVTFDAFMPRPIQRLSPEEIREKAQLLKLRLRLANYKVKTNQINVPMARLQIRTSASDRSPVLFASLPTLPTKKRTPLPSLADIPHISLESPECSHTPKSSRKTPVHIPSSPPEYRPRSRSPVLPEIQSPVKATDTPHSKLATPLLPRQRQSISHPPSLMGSPTRDDTTSSAVKKTAASGLLSLMRHQG